VFIEWYVAKSAILGLLLIMVGGQLNTSLLGPCCTLVQHEFELALVSKQAPPRAKHLPVCRCLSCSL